jgi:hypothetical protein
MQVNDVLSVINSKKTVQARGVRVLRDVAFLGPISEGEGGEIGFGPGWGMRRPNGSLYDMPSSHRKSVLKVLSNAGWINLNKGEYYSITEIGKDALKIIDTCQKCNTQRVAYTIESCYMRQYSAEKKVNVTFMCDCERREHDERVMNMGRSSFVQSKAKPYTKSS